MLRIIRLILFVLLSGGAAIGADLSAMGYDVDATTGLRMERYRAPVPDDVPGGITVTTQEAMALRQQGHAVFIDVYPPKGLGHDPLDGHWVTSEKRQSIPGSVWLPEVGRGTLDAQAEDYFKRNLVRLSHNDTSQPMVFFCTADCWQSWNASRRAIGWGYTQVHWYPLGTDGWQEDGGLLERVQPVNFFDDTTPAIEETTSMIHKSDTSVFDDTARIFLINQSGQELQIGQVRFSRADAGAIGFSVDINSERFVDQFLSMRPFRCITDPAEWFCYLPYPYELKGVVTETDLTELEYQLLFIWKAPSDFGIDPWNGIYYRLTQQDNGELHGSLLQGDLNVLASPPEPLSHPIDLSEFIDDDAKSRLFPSLVIRP